MPGDVLSWISVPSSGEKQLKNKFLDLKSKYRAYKDELEATRNNELDITISQPNNWGTLVSYFEGRDGLVLCFDVVWSQ